MEVTLGRIVYSKAGRDQGRSFLVVGQIDQNHVLVADGNLRKIEKPKKKKLKHLELTEEVVEVLGQKLCRGLKVSNSEIRKALAVLADNM